MPKKSCDIIIPVWNAFNATVECINSIIKHTDYPYRFIIIDNGSLKDTAGYLLELKNKPGPGIELIRNEENLGFVKAINQGMRASRAPYLCLMNNDTIASDGWLREMAAVAESDPKIGIVNPSSNTFGQKLEECKGMAGRVQELYSARGFCMLIKREVVEKIGFLDEIFNIGYFEETDFSLRARQCGFSIARAKGAYVYHKENLTFGELKNNKAIFDGNEKIFFARWGRPVRIGYFACGKNSEERAEKIAGLAADNGHQVFIFFKNHPLRPGGLDHINIRRIGLNTVFFGLASIFSVFRRKKKKKFEILITDDRFLGGILKMMKPLHGSEVFINVNEEELGRALEKQKRTK